MLELNKIYNEDRANSDFIYPSNILKYKIVKKNQYNNIRFHPSQKPVELFEYLIKTYSNENNIVLDNCIGSGTTAIACIRNKRNYIGFEINEEYYDVCNSRIEKEKEQLRLF